MVSERKGEGDGMLTLLHGDCKGPHLEYFVAAKKVEQVAAEKDFLHIINSFNNPVIILQPQKHHFDKHKRTHDP